MQSGLYAKFLLGLALLSIILSSGCTLCPPSICPVASTSNGVSVLAFKPDMDTIYSGEPVTFRLLLKNDGSIDAKNAHAELLGLDEDWCSSKATSDCKLSNGGRLEKLPNEPECQYTGTGFNMIATDKQRGIAGEQKTCTWSYKAPLLGIGFKNTYTPTARVFYSYKSATNKLITFDSSADLMRIRDSGGSLPSETSSSTDSPIQVSIDTSGPIRYYQDTVVFPVKISVKNSGGGVPCSQGAASEDRMKDSCKSTKSGEEPQNKITLKISLDDQTMTLDDECRELTSYGRIVPLLKGENSLSCYVQVSKLDLNAPVQKMITAEAFYEYYIDSSTTITVIGGRTPETT